MEDAVFSFSFFSEGCTLILDSPQSAWHCLCKLFLSSAGAHEWDASEVNLLGLPPSLIIVFFPFFFFGGGCSACMRDVSCSLELKKKMLESCRPTAQGKGSLDKGWKSYLEIQDRHVFADYDQRWFSRSFPRSTLPCRPSKCSKLNQSLLLQFIATADSVGSPFQLFSFPV